MRQAAPYADRLDETRIAVLLARNRELENELNLRHRQLTNFDTYLDRLAAENLQLREFTDRLNARNDEIRVLRETIAQRERELEEESYRFFREHLEAEDRVSELERKNEQLEIDLHDQKFVANLRAEVILEERAMKEDAERRLKTLEDLHRVQREMERIDQECEEILVVGESQPARVCSEWDIDLEFRPIKAHEQRWKSNSTAPLPRGLRYNVPL